MGICIGAFPGGYGVGRTGGCVGAPPVLAMASS